MAPIIESVEIARPAAEVYAYMVDPAHLTEWQEGLVSVRQQGEAGVGVGSRFVTVRRVGGRERTMTMEMVELNPPKSFRGRGVDGPVRGIVHGRVEASHSLHSLPRAVVRFACDGWVLGCGG